MFFAAIWGKTKTETRMGVAADFCPVCHKITAFSVNRVGVATHVYFVPMGEGELRNYSQTCLSCGTDFHSDPDRFVRLVQYADSPIDRLVEETFPSLRQVYSERLALEERIAADPHALDAETRWSLLMEPFQIASQFFKHRKSDTGLRVLANALRPLKPSEAEVRACLNEFRKLGAAIGNQLRTEKVMKAISNKPSLHDFDY
jgi:hypothetical protein